MVVNVKDGLVIGAVILGAVLLLPRFLQKQAVENTFALGADIQREITGGLTFAEVINNKINYPFDRKTPIIVTPNTQALGYLTTEQVTGAKSIKQDILGNVYVDGKLTKAAEINTNLKTSPSLADAINNFKNFIGIR